LRFRQIDVSQIISSTTRFGDSKTKHALFQVSRDALESYDHHADHSRRLTYVYDAVVGEFPARLQPERGQAVGLPGREEAQRGVGNVVRLQRELVQGGQHLGHRADRVVGHVYAVAQGQRHDPGRETCPQARLRDLVAPDQLQLPNALRANKITHDI